MDALPHALHSYLLDMLPLSVLLRIAEVCSLWNTLICTISEARIIVVSSPLRVHFEHIIRDAESCATVRIDGLHYFNELRLQKPIRLLGTQRSMLYGNGSIICEATNVEMQDITICWAQSFTHSFTTGILVAWGVLLMSHCRVYDEHEHFPSVESSLGSESPPQVPFQAPLIKSRFSFVSLRYCELGSHLGDVVVVRGGYLAVTKTHIRGSVHGGNGVSMWNGALANIRGCVFQNCGKHGISVMTQVGELSAPENDFIDIGGLHIFVPDDEDSSRPPRICSSASMRM